MPTTALCVHTTAKPGDFLRQVGSFLESRPVEHNILLTNAASRARGEVTDPEPALWAWADIGGHVVAAAQHTPPYGAYLSLGPTEAFQALAEGLDEARRQLPGVGGLAGGPRSFADVWARRRNILVTEGMRSRVYAATSIQPPPSVPGHLRPATSADGDLLREWARGFYADVGVPALEHDPVRRRIDKQLLFVWEADGRPVSMAASNPAAGVSRINFVYTPGPLRGHGFASACVAAVSQAQLDSGLRCMLYADAANPSNSIYQRVGYVRLADAVQLHFTNP